MLVGGGGGKLHSSLGVFVTLKNSRVRQTHEQWASENPMAWEHTPCVRPSFGTDDFCVYARVIVLGLTTERNEVTCMLGVIGEGEGEREKMKEEKGGTSQSPPFSLTFSPPPPLPLPDAISAALFAAGKTKSLKRRLLSQAVIVGMFSLLWAMNVIVSLRL